MYTKLISTSRSIMYFFYNLGGKNCANSPSCNVRHVVFKADTRGGFSGITDCSYLAYKFLGKQTPPNCIGCF